MHDSYTNTCTYINNKLTQTFSDVLKYKTLSNILNAYWYIIKMETNIP